MAFTQTDLDTINEAIASGALEVRFQDRTTIYRSMKELLMAKAEIEAELAINGGSVIIRQIRPVIHNGW